MNKVILMGRLTKDPELRTTASGISVTSFSLAVNRRFNAKDGEKQQADFFNIVAWQKQAEFVYKYFKKGQQVVVIGRLQNRSWEDAETKVKKYITEVVLEETYFADSKRDNNGTESTGNNAGEDVDLNHINLSDDDVLPF